jgi:hypothetical protein
MKPQDPQLLAKLTVRKVFNRYQAATRAIAEDEEPEKLADPDVVAGLLHKYADSALESIAREAANDALRSGRADGLQEIEKEAGEKLIWRRGSVLEDTTCNPCATADGTEIDGPDADLSQICDGGAQCRCIQYAEME